MSICVNFACIIKTVANSPAEPHPEGHCKLELNRGVVLVLIPK